MFKSDGSLADRQSVFTLRFSNCLRITAAIAVMLAALARPALAVSSGEVKDGHESSNSGIAFASIPSDSDSDYPGVESASTATVLPPSYTIRRTVPEVRIQFTVADDHGRLLHSVSSSDLRILDDRVAVPEIRNFSRLDDLPLQIGILLDVSDSVKKTAERERLAARFFLQQVLRTQTDRAALIAFSSEIRLWQRSTGDRAALEQALANVHQAGFATYLNDGVYQACREQFPTAPEGDLAQRILLLISDGDDNGSLHSLADAIFAAQRREVQIFALSVHSPRLRTNGDGTLRRLADATGGQFYLAATEKDFPAIFAAMEQQMRTQYSISFQPATQAPGPHAVSIQMAGGEKLHVRARQAYFYDAR
ncbi:MAG TPA: VWA domain-containing protein [Candidatus Angelobacter sp.]|jgi:VWFA-related protein|nr:VWA domain-containing protein [Candidatus Angelobacter sp.]